MSAPGPTELTGPAGHAVGYYVHHVGRGHLHRARALARHAAERGGLSVTGLSTLPRPDDWPGEWVHLAADDDGEARCPTARGRLHWAPLGHDGLRRRAAAVSAWVERAQPAAMVVDVSVEVALLARLHGVPVVSVVLPGHRDDPAHRLGFDVADALVGFWPAQAHDMLHGVPYEVKDRVECLGALSRFAVDPAPARAARPARATLMLGRGGHDLTDDVVDRLRSGTGRWTWTVLDGSTWVEDPSSILREADVVVTHAGQNAIAETAAARRPAVVVPQQRPHDEQRTTGAVLREGRWPAVVLDAWPDDDDAWDEALERAARLDGDAWSTWCDGLAVARFADVVVRVATA